MSGWLAPVAAALDALPRPLDFFCRDDDGGWDDEALLRLVRVHARRRVPLDVAVIPAAATAALASQLAPHRALVGVHQHGYAHVNHEPHGRRCEFGPARDLRMQRADLELGRERLRAIFGADVDPVFTPPWNRCTDDTALALDSLGFRALSRDATAVPLGVSAALLEIPVCIDWMKPRVDGAPDLPEIGRRIVAAIAAAASRAAGSAGPASAERALGLMFHHAVTTVPDLDAIDALLALLASHPRARCVRMRALLDPPAPAFAAARADEVDAA